MRFVVVGVGAAILLTLANWGLLRLGLAPFLAGLLAYGLAFGVAYSAQHGWTFGGTASHRRALPRYGLVQAGCALLAGAVTAAIALAGGDALTSALVATLAASLTSFVLSRRWAFREEPSR